MRPVDALVIGAGPAGGAAAILLARAGWSVAIVEKASFPRRKVCGEFMSATSLPLLRELGVAEAFLAQAGPAVRQIGLYAGNTKLAAAMPRSLQAPHAYGRALGRETLDALLLAGAVRAGAAVWQPWALARLDHVKDGFICTAVARHARECTTIKARIVVAAHGSWQPGTLPTQRVRCPPRPGDLFAFKAHFRSSGLPAGLMPLLVFPGGYGGMVHSDDGRTSFSCCIRRDYLERCRRRWPHVKACAAVLAHIRASCRGAAGVLAEATCDGAWLSAGPIRPGVRAFRGDGIFGVGNAAGEAHPIVAEGISMAIQSARLLCDSLIARQGTVFSAQGAQAAGREYAAGWHDNFARRVRAAALFAHLAMRPVTAAPVAALLERIPEILTMGAALSGKTQPLRRHRQIEVR